MRRVAVVTVARSDYGLWRPVLGSLERRRGLETLLVAGGAHLSRSQGLTLREIEADGRRAAARVPTVGASDTPEAVGLSMARACAGFAGAWRRLRPDLILVLGDRYEMHAAALAALPFTIPVAHVHGGELTLGAFDDSLRHSMTKLSHLHLTATAEYARRVRQLGEEPWRVAVTGSPAVDNIRATTLLSRAELERDLGLDLGRPPLLVTFHPETMAYRGAAAQTRELLAALAVRTEPLVITMPNADTGNREMRRLLRAFAARRPGTRAVESLGSRRYLSLMALAGAMVGNSSSGLIEAPSFRLPAVNLGDRQGGRARAANVIDAPCRKGAIAAALARALSPRFRASLRGLRNPYGDGRAAERIVARVAGADLDRLRRKRFFDLPGGTRA